MNSTGWKIRRCGIPVALALAIGLLSALAAQAQTYTILHNFAGQSDGATPLAGLTMDRAGNFYGTTSGGGDHGFGDIYRLMHPGSGWSFEVLYSFKGWTASYLDGAAPYSRVAIGPDGALYGTTRSGGNGQGCRELHGCGTVYKLQLGLNGVWNDKMIFQFGYYDGEDPYYGDVVFDQAGNLYGATRNGGANLMGAVYKLTPDNGAWAETVVHSFNGVDGSTPLNGPAMDAAGTLYGTTLTGGANGQGTVYRIQRSDSSWSEAVLHSFQGGSDGQTPTANPILTQTGDLYGATEAGGADGAGIAFEITQLGGSWNISTLYGFQGAAPGSSYRTLTMDSTGNLYGTSAAGGANQQGSVFKLTWSNGAWIYSTLHDFTGGSDGGAPYGILIFDSSGNIYGTASTGGAYGDGVVFEITP